MVWLDHMTTARPYGGIHAPINLGKIRLVLLLLHVSTESSKAKRLGGLVVELLTLPITKMWLTGEYSSADVLTGHIVHATQKR